MKPALLCTGQGSAQTTEGQASGSVHAETVLLAWEALPGGREGSNRHLIGEYEEAEQGDMPCLTEELPHHQHGQMSKY